MSLLFTAAQSAAETQKNSPTSGIVIRASLHKQLLETQISEKLVSEMADKLAVSLHPRNDAMSATCPLHTFIAQPQTMAG